MHSGNMSEKLLVNNSDDDEIMQARRKRQTAGQTASTVNLINVAIGAGVLSFPFAFQQGGYVWTLLLIGATVILASWTLMVLMRACNFYDADSYQELLRKAGGVKLETFAVCSMIALQFGTCTAYLIIIYDTMNPVVVFWSGASSNLTERQFIISMFACFFVFPLCCLRSLKALAPASLVAIFCVSFASFAVVFRGIETIATKGIAEGCCDLQDYFEEGNCDNVIDNQMACGCCHDERVGDERIAAFGVGVEFFAPIGIVVLALLTHVQAPSVYAEVKDPLADKDGDSPGAEPLPLLQHPDGSTPNDSVEQSKLRREQLMHKVIYNAMSFVALFYVIVGGFGYFQFGEDVQSNVLNSYGSDDNFVNVARICICCLVSVSYPILQFVARSMIHDLTSRKDEHGSEMSNLKHFGLTILYVSLTIVLAINLTDLGIVVDFIGSTVGVLAAFILPGFILMVPNGPYSAAPCHADNYIPDKRNNYFYAGVAIMVGGVFASLMSLLELFGAI